MPRKQTLKKLNKKLDNSILQESPAQTCLIYTYVQWLIVTWKIYQPRLFSSLDKLTLYRDMIHSFEDLQRLERQHLWATIFLRKSP